MGKQLIHQEQKENAQHKTARCRNPSDASCLFRLSLIAGISRDHTDAAIITPAAKSRKTLCIFILIRRGTGNTIAAPSVVIRNVKPVPPAAQINRLTP